MKKIKLKTENKQKQEEKELSYNQKYYAENKKCLSEKRKEKYKTDSEYRKKVKERAIQRWLDKIKKNPAEKMIRIDDAYFDKRKMRIVFWLGEKYKFFSIYGFAKCLGVTSATINNWHELNVIPLPKYMEDDKKWYSEVYVQNVQNALINRKEATLKELRKNVKQAFEEKPDLDFEAKKEDLTEEEREQLKDFFWRNNGIEIHQGGTAN